MRNLLQSTWVPYFLFTLFSVFLYGPNFIYLHGLPLIYNDSYAYLYQAFDVVEGNFPFSENYIFDLPFGYALFIAFIYFLGGNLQWVVFGQTLLMCSSFLLLIKFFNEKDWYFGLLASILSCFYLSTSDSLLWGTLIYTEGLFIASLVVFSFGLLKYLETKQKRFVLVLFLGLVAAVLIRSNGLYLFGLVIFLVLLTLTQRDYGATRTLILGIVSVVVISSLINSVFKSTFFPFETKRAFKQVQRLIPDKTKKKKIEQAAEVKIDPYSGTYVTQTIKLVTNFKKTHKVNHYYYRMPVYLKNQFEQSDSIEYTKYKVDTDVLDNKRLKNFTYRGLEFQEGELDELLSKFDIDSRPRHPWVFTCHIIDITGFVTRNWFFLGVFYVSFFYSFYNAIKSGFQLQNIYTKVFLFSLIHILSLLLLIVIKPRDTSLSRYAIVSEFIILFLPLLLFYYRKNETTLKNAQE